MKFANIGVLPQPYTFLSRMDVRCFGDWNRLSKVIADLVMIQGGERRTFVVGSRLDRLSR